MPTMGRDEDEHYELEASDEFHTYDATEQGGGGRVLLILVGIFVVVGLFGGILFLAYQQGMKEGIRNAPPLIEADNSPIKTNTRIESSLPTRLRPLQNWMIMQAPSTGSSV